MMILIPSLLAFVYAFLCALRSMITPLSAALTALALFACFCVGSSLPALLALNSFDFLGITGPLTGFNFCRIMGIMC